MFPYVISKLKMLFFISRTRSLIHRWRETRAQSSVKDEGTSFGKFFFYKICVCLSFIRFSGLLSLITACTRDYSSRNRMVQRTNYRLVFPQDIFLPESGELNSEFIPFCND